MPEDETDLVLCGLSDHLDKFRDAESFKPPYRQPVIRAAEQMLNHCDRVCQRRATMHRLLLGLAVVTGCLIVVSCSPAPKPAPAPSPTRTAAPTQAAIVAPTDTPEPTLAPTDTATAIPGGGTTPSAKTTPTLRLPTLARGSMRVKLFFVALDDNGKAGKKIGCGDSIVAVDRVIPATNMPLTASLKDLVSIRDQHYGLSGLYNALYQSDLKVDDVSLIDGKATIRLSGKVTLGGVCDNPRFEAQIKETALQFSTVRAVSVFINGVPLEKVLSEKGG